MTKQLSLLTRMLRLQKLYANRRAWVQGAYGTRKANHNCYCLVGGLNKIRGKKPGADFMHVKSDEAIALGFMKPSEDGYVDSLTRITDWNDAPERTIKDIRERVALGAKNARKLSKQKSTEKSQ